MDARDYIRQFRETFEARDSVAARRIARELRGEPWPTVALVCTRLMEIGLPAGRGESAAWAASHLTDVLLEAHARSAL